MWGIIGGTGLGAFNSFKSVETLSRHTPFGECSSGFERVRITEGEALFMPRHGIHHDKLPSEVNYRANIFALKQAGASKILAVSAVGSLQNELQIGNMVVPNQYIDYTKSRRVRTFSGDGFVSHVSLADPVSKELTAYLQKNTKQFDFKIHFQKTYLCMEGPSFSTRADSKVYRLLGADIVGMTQCPEYILAREAGLHYLSICFVTDYDCWDESRPHATQVEITEVMKGNNQKAFEVVDFCVNQIQAICSKGCPELGIRSGLLTPWQHIPDDKRAWLEVLMRE